MSSASTCQDVTLYETDSKPEESALMSKASDECVGFQLENSEVISDMQQTSAGE